MSPRWVGFVISNGYCVDLQLHRIIVSANSFFISWLSSQLYRHDLRLLKKSNSFVHKLNYTARNIKNASRKDYNKVFHFSMKCVDGIKQKKNSDAQWLCRKRFLQIFPNDKFFEDFTLKICVMAHIRKLADIYYM